MKDKIMPPLVLTIICIVVSGLLVLAYNATYVDNTGVLTDDMKKGCEEIFGKGDYEIMLDGEGDSKTPVTFDTEGVNSIITDKDNGRCVIEITEDGYSKGGLHLLIGINSDLSHSFFTVSLTPLPSLPITTAVFCGSFSSPSFTDLSESSAEYTVNPPFCKSVIASSVSHQYIGSLNSEPIALLTVLGANTSAQSPASITPSIENASQERIIVPILPISCKFSNIINCLLLSIVLKFRILSRCLTVINIPCGDFVSEMLSATSSLICIILQLSLSRLIHSGYFSAAAAV